MITPGFRAQDQLFIPGPALVLDPHDRYRLFARTVMPLLIQARPALAKAYGADDGRPPIDPAPLFHPTTLVHFRKRLQDHQQSATAFEAVLKGLENSGRLPRRRKERIDSTQVLGLVSHMSRLECCRATLALALKEVARAVAEPARPAWWPARWERYVESRFDFRAEPSALAEKFRQTGQDGAQVLRWLKELKPVVDGRKVRLLARVWEEEFECVPATPAAQPSARKPSAWVTAPAAGDAAALPAVAEAATPAVLPPLSGATPATGSTPGAVTTAATPALPATPVTLAPPAAAEPLAAAGPPPAAPDPLSAVRPPTAVAALTLQPKAIAPAGAVHNPHEPEAQRLAMGQELPLAQYVDAAYISAEKLAQAAADGRPLIGPAQPAPQVGQRFTTEDFQVSIAQRQAVCPAGQISSQCARLEVQATGKVNFRSVDSPAAVGAPTGAVCTDSGDGRVKKTKHRQKMSNLDST